MGYSSGSLGGGCRCRQGGERVSAQNPWRFYTRRICGVHGTSDSETIRSGGDSKDPNHPLEE